MNWGWRIAIIYTAFAVSTVGFVTFAMSEKVELVRTDYYEHSLKHDSTNAAKARGASIADQVVFETVSNELRVRLPHGQPGAKGTLQLYRPNNSGMDKVFDLDDSGVTVDIDELTTGKYNVVIEWRFGLDTYRMDRTIEVA
jgi:hypothetical protein